MDIATSVKWALEVSNIDSGIDLVEAREFAENAKHQMKKEMVVTHQVNDHHEIIDDIEVQLAQGILICRSLSNKT